MTSKLNELNGKQWLQYSFSIWRDIRRNDNGEKKMHPASFPVELPARVIRIFTKLGEVVLDPFMGSGSTVLAALNENRNAIGIELS
ncbi:MAG: DNA methyltransferase [Thermoplasmataceae archaeon]